MSDWQAGDLALCIREGSWTAYGIGLRRGQIHPVERVYDPDDVGEEAAGAHPCYLEFAPWAPDNTFGCGAFIKVTPGELTGDDLEVVTLMASKPAPVRQ